MWRHFKRCSESEWTEVRGPVDLFVLEGWCLGAFPQPEVLLEKPVNLLESTEDPEGIWRSYVNDALGDAGEFAALSAMFEYLIFLCVPDMASVIRWRTEQEQALPVEKRMGDENLQRFIAHYERLTTWMLESTARHADMTVNLAPDHTVRAVDVKTS